MRSSCDPTAAVLESQWTAILIDDFGLPFSTWFTLGITGFNNIDKFFISHTTSGLAIDSIVIDVYDVVPVPEPTSAALIGLGLVGLATRARRERVA
jgi:hypothetical protein